jgi:hypothetical protein
MKMPSNPAAGFLGWILSLLCLMAPLGAQTILYPQPDQDRVPLKGKDLLGEDIPGVLFELTVREGSPTGRVAFHRTHAAHPNLSMDGLKPNTNYYGFIRIIGRNTSAMVRFFTGPRPEFSAYHPPVYNMIPGEPVEVTGSTSGAVDSVAWIDSLGRSRSTNNTLKLPTDPNVAGIYTFVVTGPGRVDKIPVWVRWMAAPVIRELPEFIPVPLGESRTLNAVVDGLDVSLAWRLFPADGSAEDAPVASTNAALPLGPEFLQGTWNAELTASNLAGSTTTTVQVEFGSAPMHANPMATTHAEVGEPFVLTSEWEGTQPTHTRWTRPDGVVLPWVEGTDLEIDEVQFAHNGTWSVQAVNPFGTTHSHLQLRVVPRPDICIDLPPKLTLPRGAVLALGVVPCVVGDPIMEFEWYHNDVKIPGAFGTLLVRSNLTEALTGTYRATVRTQFREVESTECVITLQPTVPTGPLRLKIEPVEVGIRLSWPEGYALGTASGFHQLESSADLTDWWTYDTENLQPILRSGRWHLDLPTLDPESALTGEFFRIVPWQASGE